MTALRLILGGAAALGAGSAWADALSQPPPDSTAVELVGEVLRVLQAFGIVPVWGVVLGAVLAAVAVVLLRHLGLGALLRRGVTYLRKLEPPPDPVEHPPAPPMDLPAGGMPVPGPTRREGDP